MNCYKCGRKVPEHFVYENFKQCLSCKQYVCGRHRRVTNWVKDIVYCHFCWNLIYAPRNEVL